MPSRDGYDGPWRPRGARGDAYRSSIGASMHRPEDERSPAGEWMRQAARSPESPYFGTVNSTKAT